MQEAIKLAEAASDDEVVKHRNTGKGRHHAAIGVHVFRSYF